MAKRANKSAKSKRDNSASWAERIKKQANQTGSRVVRQIDSHPIRSFFIVLLVLLALIVIGNFLRAPQTEENQTEKIPLEVSTYSIGQTPKITVSGKVEKTGVVSINAQTSGVVGAINVQPGQQISRGTSLVSISSNYWGASALSAQRQLAATQVAFVNETYDLQKETINTQREIAEKQEDNSEELRQISESSVGETESLIDLNEDILDTLNENLETLEDTNIGGVNDDAILATKQQISQYKQATNAARSSLRNLKLNSGEDEPPTELNKLTKDLTLKQLDLQEKTLELNKETAALQLKVAQINESLAYPVAPFDAIVERVYVNPFEQVSPGDPLVLLTEIEDPASVIVTVPKSIAQSVSLFEPAVLYLGDEIISQTPAFVSSEPTDGRLFSVLFNIPDHLENSVAIGQIVSVELPVGSPDTGSAFPFVPIDTVHQTQDNAIVYVVQDGIAASREVSLGSVQGSYVEIISGLEAGDQIIVDRRVINGDAVIVSEDQ